MAVTPRTNIVEEARAKLLSIDQGKDLIEKTLAVFTEEVQELETAVFATIADNTLETAPLHRLQVLAKSVGQSDTAHSEEVLRALIRGRTVLARSSGDVRDFELVSTAVGLDPETTSVHTYGQATAQFFSFEAVDPSSLVAYAILFDDVRAAGVSLYSTLWSDATVVDFTPGPYPGSTPDGLHFGPNVSMPAVVQGN